MIKKLGILGVLVIVLMAVLVSATENSELRIDNIRFLDYDLAPGSYSEMILSLENHVSSKLKNMEISVMLLPEFKKLNIYQTEFDVKRGDIENRRILLYIPQDVEPGYYLIRVTASNGEEKRTKIVGAYIN